MGKWCKSYSKIAEFLPLDHCCGPPKECRCAEIDPRLAQLTFFERGRVSLEEHAALGQKVLAGHALAMHFISSAFFRWPSSERGFQLVVRALHVAVFVGTDLPFAGKIRKKDEPEVSCGRGKHEFVGESPDRIDAALAELYRNVLADFDPNESRTTFVRRCARFLEEYFRIHPFHDGNGRIARLLLRLLAQATRAFVFDQFPRDSSGYVRALEFAHQQVNNRGIDGRGRSDPYALLGEWLGKYLINTPASPSEDTAPPPWIDSSSKKSPTE